eukprot:gene624-113_t
MNVEFHFDQVTSTNGSRTTFQLKNAFEKLAKDQKIQDDLKVSVEDGAVIPFSINKKVGAVTTVSLEFCRVLNTSNMHLVLGCQDKIEQFEDHRLIAIMGDRASLIMHILHTISERCRVGGRQAPTHISIPQKDVLLHMLQFAPRYRSAKLYCSVCRLELQNSAGLRRHLRIKKCQPVSDEKEKDSDNKGEEVVEQENVPSPKQVKKPTQVLPPKHLLLKTSNTINNNNSVSSGSNVGKGTGYGPARNKYYGQLAPPPKPVVIYNPATDSYQLSNAGPTRFVGYQPYGHKNPCQRVVCRIVPYASSVVMLDWNKRVVAS